MFRLNCVPVIALAVAGALAASGASAEQARVRLAQACGWYAIFSCGHNPNAQGPGHVVWTSDYPNFRPGFYCNVIGPSSYDSAVDNANRYGGYAKSAC
jgi:hypothetical protein